VCEAEVTPLAVKTLSGSLTQNLCPSPSHPVLKTPHCKFFTRKHWRQYPLANVTLAVLAQIINHWGYFIYLNWMPTYFVKVSHLMECCCSLSKSSRFGVTRTSITAAEKLSIMAAGTWL
jgi:hypothetical protein